MRLILSLSLLCLPMFATGCGGGGGAPAPIATGDYELRVVGLPTQGVQVGRAFSVRLAFVRPGSGDPTAPPAGEAITVRVISAAGVESSSFQVALSGSTDFVLPDVVIPNQGVFLLEFEAPNAVGLVRSSTFTVGPPLDLEFDAPDLILDGRAFATRVRIVDPASGTAVVPSFPVDLTVFVIGGAATTAVIDGATEVLVEGLMPVANTTTTQLAVQAFGFGTVESAPIPTDRLALLGLAQSGSQIVNGEFTLTGTIALQSTGQPVAADPPVTVQVSGSGAGALSGVTTATTVGDTFSVGPMRWDANGPVSLDVSAAVFDTVSLLTSFDFQLAVQNIGPATSLPNVPLGPAEFSIVDALGAATSGAADPLSWLLLRASDSSVVAAGAADFVGGVASVAPIGGGAGEYLLTGSTPSAAGTVTVTLEVAFDPLFAPGPFVALRSTRVGSTFSDGVAFAALPSTVTTPPVYGLLEGALPPGLTLDAQSGAIQGSATTAGDYEFTLWARQSDTELQPLRCALAVFESDESDVSQAPPDFSVPGPFAGQITAFDDSWSFISSFDAALRSTASRIWMPPASAGAVPLFVMHRTRDVAYTEYELFGQHLAGWGIAFASVEDTLSFRAPGPIAPDFDYDVNVVHAGIESGAAYLEATVERMLERSAAQGDALEGRIDPVRFFIGGHGRGGGSAHAAHHRTVINNARGYVYLMPFDLRLLAAAAPPGQPMGTPVYPVPDAQPRAPQLILTAENDGDMQFPFGDQLVERRVGPTTMVTIYGGCNAFMTDTGVLDALLATITRPEQLAITGSFVTAFIKRWSGDRSLDGLLYRDVAPASTTVGVQTWRNMSSRILVDDFQDGIQTTNLLGGTNTLTLGSRAEDSIYPGFGGLTAIPILQNKLFLSGLTDTEYQTTLGGLDVTAARRVAMRVGQKKLIGFDWVTLRVRLVDATGAESMVTVWDHVTQQGRLPDFGLASPNVYDRVVDLEVELSEFTGIDLSNLTRLDIVFATDGTFDAERQVYLDDLRFE